MGNICTSPANYKSSESKPIPNTEDKNALLKQVLILIIIYFLCIKYTKISYVPKIQRHKDIDQWDADDVYKWLSTVENGDLRELAGKLRHERVKGKILDQLNDEIFKEINISIGDKLLFKQVRDELFHEYNYQHNNVNVLPRHGILTNNDSNNTYNNSDDNRSIHSHPSNEQQQQQQQQHTQPQRPTASIQIGSAAGIRTVYNQPSSSFHQHQQFRSREQQKMGLSPFQATRSSPNLQNGNIVLPNTSIQQIQPTTLQSSTSHNSTFQDNNIMVNGQFDENQYQEIDINDIQTNDDNHDNHNHHQQEGNPNTDKNKNKNANNDNNKKPNLIRATSAPADDGKKLQQQKSIYQRQYNSNPINGCKHKIKMNLITNDCNSVCIT